MVAVIATVAHAHEVVKVAVQFRFTGKVYQQSGNSFHIYCIERFTKFMVRPATFIVRSVHSGTFIVRSANFIVRSFISGTFIVRSSTFIVRSLPIVRKCETNGQLP